MAGNCSSGAAGWGWRSLIAKGQVKKERKKKKNPPRSPLLNAASFSGWAGGVVTCTGAQSSIPEGPLL